MPRIVRDIARKIDLTPRMGDLARTDDYSDPMTGFSIGGGGMPPELPVDPRGFTADWARVSAMHPQAFEPQDTMWPEYPSPLPKEVPEDRPNPLIPFSAYRSKPPTHRVGDLAAQTIIEQGASMLPGRLGVAIGSVLSPDDAEAARWIKYPFNRIAVGDTIGNLAKRNAYAPAKDIAEHTIQPHDIPVGSWLTPLVGDRSRSGEFLTHIGEKELANPVSLQGGYQFTPEWKGEGVAWASDRSPISTMGRRVREFQGRDVPGVYGVYTPMSTQSIDASHHVSDALSQMMKLEKDNISKTAIEKFDAKMGGDFPGVTSENLQEYLRGKPMSYRNDFVKAMNTKAAREAGFPDVEQARIAITHPDLIDTPNYAGGNAIAKLTGDVSHYNKGGGLAPHYTYPSKLHGEYMGGLAEALPQELLWRDLAPKIAARNPSAAGKIWLTGLKGEPFGQQVDRQWQDAAAEYFRRQQRGD